MRYKHIAVHGLGYVGLTAAVHWAKAGWIVIAYDPDQKTIDALCSGAPRAGDFLSYLQADIKELLPSEGLLALWRSTDQERFQALEAISRSQGWIFPTFDFTDTIGCNVHSVAVPTEKDGEPYDKIIDGVLDRLIENGEVGATILVESTLTPGTIDRFLKRHPLESNPEPLHPGGGYADDDLRNGMHIAVCPRRDWFADPKQNLRTMKRVVGGVLPCCTERAVGLLKNISDDIETPVSLTGEPAYRAVELTKALENAMLHGLIMLGTEFALNNPQLDVAEAVRLATTHPRLVPVFLGAGSGGRCVPLGPRYLQTSRGPHEILNAALAADRHVRHACARVVAKRGCKTCLVLGIGYRPSFKDAGHSPGLAVAQHLRRDFGIETTVADPCWTKSELEELTGFPVETFKVPDLAAGETQTVYDAIVLATPHPEYIQLPLNEVHWKRGQIVLDAQGAWRNFVPLLRERGCQYFQVGMSGWF